jgi:hypothetical protein
LFDSGLLAEGAQRPCRPRWLNRTFGSVAPQTPKSARSWRRRACPRRAAQARPRRRPGQQGHEEARPEPAALTEDEHVLPTGSKRS